MLGLATLLILSWAPQEAKFVDPLQAYSFVLPAGWRQITPDEHRLLRDKLPRDVATRLIPTRIDRFGDVDQWLKEGFDGRCLTIHREDGEPAMTAETLKEVRETAQSKSASTAFRYVIEDLEIGTVGEHAHPAIVSRLKVAHSEAGELARVLEFVIPTGGKTVRFSYRAGPKDFDAALPIFRKSAETLEIASPPRGRKELSDKLEMPLIIGGVVGLVFLVLYKMRRG